MPARRTNAPGPPIAAIVAFRVAGGPSFGSIKTERHAKPTSEIESGRFDGGGDALACLIDVMSVRPSVCPAAVKLDAQMLKCCVPLRPESPSLASPPLLANVAQPISRFR